MGQQERIDRIARNEASFRSINETLEQGLHQVQRDEAELAGFVCECGDRDCSELVYLDLAKYEQIRADSRTFLIVPGHDLPEAEDVVESGERYAIVQKHEDVRGIVESSRRAPQDRQLTRAPRMRHRRPTRAATSNGSTTAP